MFPIHFLVFFFLLAFIGYLIYLLYIFLTRSPSKKHNRHKVEMYKLTGTLIRQRFTLLGRVGVTMVLLAPVAGSFIITVSSEAITQAFFLIGTSPISRGFI